MSRATGQPATGAATWAEGPLGKSLGEFPLRFSVAALIADCSFSDGHLNNGTATLLALGCGKLAITCSHVLDKYREIRESGRKAIFQIGNVRLDPTEQLIDEDSRADLATISMSEGQASALMKNEGMGAQFFHPRTWPPEPVKENDVLALGGFPGKWREVVAPRALDFNGYGIGATAATSVTEEKIVCQFERHRWVWSSKRGGLRKIEEIGGMSGGPAFVLRPLHLDFAGIMYQFNPSFELMFLRPARIINGDGTIVFDDFGGARVTFPPYLSPKRR